MSDVMTAKLNEGFLMRPYSFFHAGEGSPTRSETMVRGWIYSMTRQEGVVCRFGYGKFAEKFGLSRSTVARTVRSLRAKGAIFAQRFGAQTSAYTYTESVSSKAHVRTETWFYTYIFAVGGSDRRLTNAEIDVLSLIYTHTRNERAKCYEGGIRDIAGILNLSEKTVMRCITALFAADLIVRPTKGLNKHSKTVFRANMKVLRRMDKQVKKEEKARQEGRLPDYVVAANAKAAREKYYADKREKAISLAERFEERAKENPRFIEIEREISKLNLDMAKAELYAPLSLATLQARQAALRAERVDVLSAAGIQEWQLLPQFECKLCDDTGFRLSDGVACTCDRCRE